MGIIAAPGNATFPHANWAYDASPGTLITPPLAYGADITLDTITLTCPRPIFPAGGWASRYFRYYTLSSWWSVIIHYNVAPYQLVLYSPPDPTIPPNAAFYVNRYSDDSSIANVARRLQSPPNPLPCTIHNARLWIDAPDFATLQHPQYTES